MQIPESFLWEKKEVKVVDVQEKNEIVTHYVTDAIEQGSKVTGRLNYKERFSKMQQHTGEHIVSGIVNRRFGYNNVGFHLGNEEVTMDFDGMLTETDLKEIEWEANQAVADNVKIQVLYPTKEELENDDLQKQNRNRRTGSYRSDSGLGQLCLLCTARRCYRSDWLN